MGKLKCVSSLLSCVSSSRKNRRDDNNRNAGNFRGSVTCRPNPGGKARNVNFADEPKLKLDRPLSPPQSRPGDAVSVGSVTSGKSSVYFEANEGDRKDWQLPDGDDSFHSLDSFGELEIDGQYFFLARDDPNLTRDDYNLAKDALEGIHLYPPIPTTEPDPALKSPVSLSNMQTLLHSYQHVPQSLEEKRQEDDELANTEKLGLALEHQAERLLLAPENRGLTTSGMGISTKLLLQDLKAPKIRVREKGFPGELTEKELEAVTVFRSELDKRDPVYKGIVQSFSVVEKEAYALCRFLRARKFDVDKVFELLDEAKDAWAEAKKNNFYPDLESSMGVSKAIFLSQYPAVMSGNAKNGCPVMYLRTGLIKPDGIKCIVSIDKVDKFFWNDTMYSFTAKLKDGREQNPNFVRCETLTIYDLKGVSRSQINSDTFDMIKVGNGVMTSFPETLHCLLIINAPSWFGFVWAIVKKLIDPRTASKIEVFTNAKSGLERMNELIDSSQIPSDYGGIGPTLAKAAGGMSNVDSSRRTKVVNFNHLIQLSKKNPENECTFEIEAEKQLTITVYSRCKTGCTATVTRVGDSNIFFELDVVGDVEEEPYHRTIGAVKEPGSYRVKLKSLSTHGNYLVVGTSYTGLSLTSDIRSKESIVD